MAVELPRGFRNTRATVSLFSLCSGLLFHERRISGFKCPPDELLTGLFEMEDLTLMALPRIFGGDGGAASSTSRSQPGHPDNPLTRRAQTIVSLT